jgi:hypothetical protein
MMHTSSVFPSTAGKMALAVPLPEKANSMTNWPRRKEGDKIPSPLMKDH